MLIWYLTAVNIVAFAVFGADKWKAVHGRWRIRESVLLGLAFVGGSPGGLLAMYLFRHKTKKPVFAVGIPLMLAVQIALFFWLKRGGI